jgi:predicted nucleic acid-binding protein
MLLLDTNVVSELRKVSHARTDPNFIAWSKSLRWADLFLSAITLYELEIGVSRLETHDLVRGKVVREWLRDKLMPRFESRILPVGADIALRSAHLQISRTRQVEDTLIASTAFVHHMPLVTRNVRDFEDTGVTVINPWNDPQHRP